MKSLDLSLQSVIHKNRYLLNASTITPSEHIDHVMGLLHDFNLKSGRFPYSKERESNDTCNWIQNNAWVEPSKYDYTIPVSYVTPVKFFDTNDPWNLLLWCYDPYNSEPEDAIKSPSAIANWFKEKDERFMPKSLLIEHLELAWIGYEDIHGMILIHHIQLRGTLKSLLSRNDLLWWYRYLVRMIPHMFPHTRWKDIFIPDAHSFQTFTERQTTHTKVPMQPFSKHVLKRSDFTKVEYVDIKDEYPEAMKKFLPLEHLTEQEITFWRYEYDNPHTLALQVLSSR